MTRRLTITSAEMGNLVERPNLNLPLGGEATPIKKDVFWPKPSKWQICMPRLRSVLNTIIGLAALALVVKVLSQGPPKSREHTPITPAQPPDNPEQNFREPTEAEMIERSKREDWIWKDYDLCVPTHARSGQNADPHSSHYGLTRGLSDLKACVPEDPKCVDSTPQLVRYTGYKHLQEDETDIVSCIGPRGIPMNESDDDAVWAYNGIAHGS